MTFEILTFREIGYNPDVDMSDLTPAQIRAEIVQLACNYLMDGRYAEFNEFDVIESYDDILIDWRAGTVLVPVKPTWKRVTLQ
jgi:hypothetical protein